MRRCSLDRPSSGMRPWGPPRMSTLLLEPSFSMSPTLSSQDMQLAGHCRLPVTYPAGDGTAVQELLLEQGHACCQHPGWRQECVAKSEVVEMEEVRGSYVSGEESAPAGVTAMHLHVWQEHLPDHSFIRRHIGC